MDKMNKLILGDNLEILKLMPSESVDLIYLDPPFFSNRHYECIDKIEAIYTNLTFVETFVNYS